MKIVYQSYNPLLSNLPEKNIKIYENIFFKYEKLSDRIPPTILTDIWTCLYLRAFSWYWVLKLFLNLFLWRVPTISTFESFWSFIFFSFSWLTAAWHISYISSYLKPTPRLSAMLTPAPRAWLTEHHFKITFRTSIWNIGRTGSREPSDTSYIRQVHFRKTQSCISVCLISDFLHLLWCIKNIRECNPCKGNVSRALPPTRSPLLLALWCSCTGCTTSLILSRTCPALPPFLGPSLTTGTEPALRSNTEWDLLSSCWEGPRTPNVIVRCHSELPGDHFAKFIQLFLNILITWVKILPIAKFCEIMANCKCKM